MNYLDEKRSNALASQYVLGTLSGKARIRYQRLVMQQPDMRKTLWQWEAYLNELGCALPSQHLPPHLWENIQKRLGFINEETIENIIPLRRKKSAALPWLTGFSIAAAIMFAVLLFTQNATKSPIHFETQYAIFQSEKAQALWLIEVNKDSIKVQATNKLQADADKDYELWLVAKDGRAPVSLGLLPKNGKMVLPRKAILDKVDIAALAVSLEPLGGSPNGQPTKVLYTAELVAI